MKTIWNWVQLWNRGGYEALRPNFSGGPMLSDKEWDKVVDEIEEKGMDVKDVVVYVRNTRGVVYSYKTVWWRLRKKEVARYGKGYRVNEKRHDDSEEVLKRG